MIRYRLAMLATAALILAPATPAAAQATAVDLDRFDCRWFEITDPTMRRTLRIDVLEPIALHMSATHHTAHDLYAAANEADLIARCVALAAGEAPSQDCRRLIDPDLIDDLRFTRVGQHFIVFVEMADQVIIVDVLHSRSDLPRRLAALGDPRAPDQG